VGLHLNTNEVRVMRITNDTQIVKDYKKVDKDDLTVKLVGTVHVDCAYQGNYLGVSTYVIGIAGTYFTTNQLRAFYLAKFSTKYNLTEDVAISN